MNHFSDEASSDNSRLSVALDRAREGNRDDLEQLFGMCRSYLRVMAHCQVNRCLQGKVSDSDLVQQTMIDAYQGWNGFRGKSPGELLAWLRQLLTNNAVDHYRKYAQTEKRQVSREVSLDLPGNGILSGMNRELSGDQSTPSRQLMRRESELVLAEAIDRLSERHRNVIILRSLQRLPFIRVAEEMGCSQNAAQMLWGRAIKHLKAEYDSLLGDSIEES